MLAHSLQILASEGEKITTRYTLVLNRVQLLERNQCLKSQWQQSGRSDMDTSLDHYFVAQDFQLCVWNNEEVCLNFSCWHFGTGMRVWLPMYPSEEKKIIWCFIPFKRILCVCAFYVYDRCSSKILFCFAFSWQADKIIELIIIVSVPVISYTVSLC